MFPYNPLEKVSRPFVKKSRHSYLFLTYLATLPRGVPWAGNQSVTLGGDQSVTGGPLLSNWMTWTKRFPNQSQTLKQLERGKTMYQNQRCCCAQARRRDRKSDNKDCENKGETNVLNAKRHVILSNLNKRGGNHVQELGWYPQHARWNDRWYSSSPVGSVQRGRQAGATGMAQSRLHNLSCNRRASGVASCSFSVFLIDKNRGMQEWGKQNWKAKACRNGNYLQNSVSNSGPKWSK